MLNPNVFPHLKGEQCEVLYLPRFSNQIVLGVAESGKSLEAIYRSTWISMSDPNEKMVILTFNHDISEDIKKKRTIFFSKFLRCIQRMEFEVCIFLI